MFIPKIINNIGLVNNLTKSTSLTNGLKCSPVLINSVQVRYRKAVSFRRYKQPDFRQKLLLAVCEPIFPRDHRPSSEKCFNLTELPPKPDHPYDVLLAKDLLDELKNSSIAIIFHQNQMNTNERRLLKNEYEHEGFALRYYNRDIVRIACTETRFKPLNDFAVDYHFTILFGNKIEKIPKLIRIAKKYPGVIPIAALLDQRRLLTIKQLETLPELINLDTQRAMLCHTLNVAQQGLLRSLNHHQTELSRLLKSHSSDESSQ
ncbi:hypothetical protein RDWZM_007434 [Blomia tropicalis]|uniref:Large ribosomal subunit protein uL10m n=1 Tax=Blomia tropicalis TaxID=40697 RepID=A0A9Q0LZV9_BLOTA|nr:hypothetical protein BLOT_015984 [Blomia tropicalis]KAJ6216277.1 hypothetical protein RDWZM_007434 [Blomia tropicalis]